MANIYVTGPCHIYVGFGTIDSSGVASPTTVPSAIYYLGTAERAPVVNFVKQFEDVANDVAGIAFPVDRTYQGEEATTQMTLSRWNEAVYQRLMTGAKPNSGTPGIDTATDLGTALHLEGGSFHTWLHFPYVTKAYGTIYGMKKGYHFYSSRVASQGVDPGTKAKKRSVALQFARVFNGSDCTWILYDQEGSAWSSIPAHPCSIGSTGLVS